MAQEIANQSHIQKYQTRHVEHPRLRLWTDLILGQMSQSQMPFDPSQMYQKNDTSQQPLAAP